jgi:hypothetical protein
MGWTLADIRRKVRQVTGRLSSNQLLDSTIDTYINNYYQFILPAELKLEKEHTYYTFQTEQYEQFYDFADTSYTNIEPPVYVDLKPMMYYQDPVVYFNENPEQIQRLIPWTGDGTTQTFSNVVQFPFISPGTVIVTDEVETFTDDGNGILTGDQGGIGNVNYTTGAITVTFFVAPVASVSIWESFEVIPLGQPVAVLFYNSQFRFYPVPDTVYRVQMKAYKIPDPLVDGTDTPTLQEWGECLAYGAARDLVMDYGEMDRYSEITMLYKEQVGYIITRTLQNLMNERARPMF